MTRNIDFAAVAVMASNQNNWEVIGVAMRPSEEGCFDGGFIVFNRPALDNDQNRKMHGTDISYGTSSFNLEGEGKVSFHHGHYDMNREAALDDFTARIRKGY